MAWEYKREESTSERMVIPEGEHRIRIKSADKAVSKSGNDMLKLTFEVSGYNSLLFHYIVFMADRPEITNRMLTQFFDSFKDIPEGDFDTSHWIGKVGAAKLKHEQYNGNTSAKVHYFIRANKQNELPAWREPTNNTTASTSNTTGGYADIAIEDMPF